MMTRLNISISDELKRRVRSAAALRNETVAEVVRRALEQYVDEVPTAEHPESKELTPDQQRALEALAEARRVAEMMVEHYGVRPAGWAAHAIREFREEMCG